MNRSYTTQGARSAARHSVLPPCLGSDRALSWPPHSYRLDGKGVRKRIIQRTDVTAWHWWLFPSATDGSF